MKIRKMKRRNMCQQRNYEYSTIEGLMLKGIKYRRTIYGNSRMERIGYVHACFHKSRDIGENRMSFEVYQRNYGFFTEGRGWNNLERRIKAFFKNCEKTKVSFLPFQDIQHMFGNQGD